MALTKEAYKKLNDNTNGIRFIRPFSEYTLQEVIEALTELEELKKDVARYFELTELQADEAIFPTEYLFTDDDWRELNYLEEKLLKVGKEK